VQIFLGRLDQKFAVILDEPNFRTS
jgi:hypothetical protein